jgi:hypothetical protein
MRRRRAAALLVVVMSAGGCTSSSDLPVSFLVGLRVVAIVAEPPEIAAGESAAVTVHVVDTEGLTPAVSWSRCLRAPLPGEIVNPDCVKSATAPYLEPIGEGAAITVTMPDVATYRLRLAEAGRPPNANPGTVAVAVAGDAGLQVLDPAAPPVVHAGDRLTLQALLAPGAAETYTVDLGAGSETVTETLTTAWFTTAGELSRTHTSAADPGNELSLDRRLPAAPARIDVHVVTRDERGGTSLLQVSLQLQ